MTDLEELFRPLIDDGARHREPVATIEMRARDRQSQHRRQRAQYRVGVGFVAVALIAATVGIVRANRDDGAGRAAPIVTTAAPATDAAPTVPPGWVSYDYGLARISVPPNFKAVTGNGCGAPDGPIIEMQDPNDRDNRVCGHDPEVVLLPISGPAGAKPPGLPSMVNGIEYYSVPAHCTSGPVPPATAPSYAPACVPSIWVPALNLVVFFSFSLDQRIDMAAIIDTLTYSTYARVLRQPFGSAPTSWKTVTFGGYSVRVPADWPTIDLAKTGGFCSPAANTVYTGSARSAPNCAPRTTEAVAPTAWLELSRIPVGVSNMPGFVTDLHDNGLTLARHPVDHPFVDQMWFTIEGAHGRVELTVGLGLDSAVTRGILGSVRAVAG